jgi:Ca-activated chloride channel family protein
MSFASPLLLIPSLAIFAVFVVATIRGTRRRAAIFSEAGLTLPPSRSRTASVVLNLAGVAVLALAVSGPSAPLPVTRAAGTVILAMDVSNSMGATDVDPSRLEAAKQAALGFIDAQPDSVDIGVVAFQSDALQTSIASSDHSVAATAVARLTGTGGTSLAAAILASLTTIAGKPVTLPEDDGRTGVRTIATQEEDLGFWPSATIVLFSDGENFNGSIERLVAATELAQTMGVRIATVGVGTTAGAEVEVDGFLMHTALDEELLAAISETSGGQYLPATDAAELAGVADGIDLRLTTKNQDVPLAGALAGLGVALLLAGSMLTLRRTGRLL